MCAHPRPINGGAGITAAHPTKAAVVRIEHEPCV
jgi:hypothetical protein